MYQHPSGLMFDQRDDERASYGLVSGCPRGQAAAPRPARWGLAAISKADGPRIIEAADEGGAMREIAPRKRWAYFPPGR